MMSGMHRSQEKIKLLFTSFNQALSNLERSVELASEKAALSGLTVLWQEYGLALGFHGLDVVESCQGFPKSLLWCHVYHRTFLNGYPSIRHNKIHDIIAHLSDWGEPWGTSGTTPPAYHRRAISSGFIKINVKDGMFLDIAVEGFWGGNCEMQSQIISP